MWDNLLVQIELTINLIRQATLNPIMFAWEYFNGAFDYTVTPLGPIGCKIIIHTISNKRKSWDQRRREGFSVGPALQHYCCIQAIDYIFHKGFCTVYFRAYKKNAVTLPHSAQRKHAFAGKIKNMSKKNKSPARKKIALELLHQILGHRSTRSLLAGDTDNVWEYVELRIDTDPFCNSCQISSMKKKARSNIPLKPKAPFKWVFMDIIPSTSPKILTSDTTFSNYLLIVNAYSKIPKLYGMEKITT